MRVFLNKKKKKTQYQMCRCKAFCFLSQFYEQPPVPVLPKRGADLASNLETLTNSTRRKRNKEAKRSKRRGEKHLEIPPLRLPADSATASKAGSRQLGKYH